MLSLCIINAMKILHFSDIHFWEKQFEWQDAWYPKRTLGYINLSLFRHRKFPPEYAQRVADQILREEADVVIFSGDMSTMSLDAEFAKAATAFAPIREKWGDRFFVIPGNHDRYTPRSVGARRYEAHFPYGVLDGESRLVTRRDIGESLTLVGFDSSKPYAVRSNGVMHEALISELENLLAECTREKRATILVGHFPFVTPPDQAESWEHGLLHQDRLVTLVARHKPTAYLHGHKHARWCIRHPQAPGTLCINSGSAGMKSSDPLKQAGFVTFEVNDSEISDLTAVVFNENTDTFDRTAVAITESAKHE